MAMPRVSLRGLGGTAGLLLSQALCWSALAQNPPGARARPGRLELAASGGYFTASRFEFAGIGLNAGPGFQAALRYRILGNVLLEIGGHWSDHDVAWPDSLLPLVNSSPDALRLVSIRALYVQPTVRLGSPASAIQPFLGPRFGVARWEGHRTLAWDTGRIYGGVLGLHSRLGRWVALDACGSFTHIAFDGGTREGIVGTSITIQLLPRVEANSVGAQAGLSLSLPWLGR
jgi:hypothetical protein